MPEERLHKIIAAAGVASRRKAEELITEGRVVVNGTVVTTLGSKADPATDHIRVDGKLLSAPDRHVYIMLNKPKGYITTVSDEKNRPTVMDLIKSVHERVYPVGRLDYASEGLLLFTNDGDLAGKLMKASSHVAKKYVVKVAGQPSEEGLNKLRKGILLREPGARTVQTAPALITQIKEADNPWFEVTLIEGRNRQIRNMFEEIGNHVEKIRRVKYGPLSLDVPPGEYRSLTLAEVARLKAAVSEAASAKTTVVVSRTLPPPRREPTRAATAPKPPKLLDAAPTETILAAASRRDPIRASAFRSGPKRTDPKRSGPPTSRPSRSGPPRESQRPGSELRGSERSGSERREPSRRPAYAGPKRSGPPTGRPNRSGPPRDSRRPVSERPSSERPGSERREPSRRPAYAGPKRTGPPTGRPSRSGPPRGPERPRSDRSGPSGRPTFSGSKRSAPPRSGSGRPPGRPPDRRGGSTRPGANTGKAPFYKNRAPSRTPSRRGSTLAPKPPDVAS